MGPAPDEIDDRSTPGPRNKVARVIDEYDLGSAPEYLEGAWTDSEDRKSLRDLAEDFNRRILRSAMEEADLDPIDEDVESAYRALTSSSNPASRVQKTRELQRAGLDVERLQADFVSHQAIHTYLRKYRGVSPPDASPEDRLDSARQRIQRIQGRTTAVAEDALADLRDRGELGVGDFDVVASVDVHCEDCGRSYAVDELLRRGGCPCHLDED